MSASPFLSHFSNAVVSFPFHQTTISTPFAYPTSSKYSFITFSSSPNNGSNSRKVEPRRIKRESRDYHAQSSKSIPHSRSTTKAPTAPWMTEPLLVMPSEMKSMKRQIKKGLGFDRAGEHHPDEDLTGKVGGARGRLAMKKIYKGFEKLLESQDLEATSRNHEDRKFKFTPGDLCGYEDYGGDVEVLEKCKAAEERLRSDEFHIPLFDAGNEVKSRKLPWEREDKVVIRRAVKEKVVTAAELSLDEMLLERLRYEAAQMKKWVKVMKAGVTQAVVDQVHSFWRDNELALIKFDVPLCRNMDRAREIVELKTGGLVVWGNKDLLAVYRGCNYGRGSKDLQNMNYNSARDQRNSSPMNYENTMTVARVTSGGSNPDELSRRGDDKWENVQMASLYERETDRLLDELGPRFVDWWMRKPLPVDGDLLPAIVPGFKTPFRLCPPFTRAKLADEELTYLRKLARPLPFHFVLGRNRNLQGLAAAILKLWEKCHIAKIAVKWGALNTDNEQMANELKRLTGGVLLLRNKYLIIMYRGKDFLPSEVAKVVSEREMELTQCQLHEEAARLKASENFSITYEHIISSDVMGTLSEFHRVHSEMGSLKKGKTEVDVKLEAERGRLEKELKDQERRLFNLKKKIEKSTRVLDKLKNESRLSEEEPDLEIISKEERVCLREMGLRLKSSLVLGRRGIYDGVIEAMHQHWKHREVVKVITLQKTFPQVMNTAKCLETESGGILVAVFKLKEGHAIIVYRGKNYKRPKSAAINLLNKKEALSRSLEIQRRGSLKFFARQREQAICELKQKLDLTKEEMVETLERIITIA